MALLEGGGGPTSTGASKSEPRKKSAPSSSSARRLQSYTAEPTETALANLEAALETIAAPAAAPAPTSLTAPDGTEFGGMSLPTYGADDSESEKVNPTPDREALTTAQAEAKSKDYRARKTEAMSWDDYLDLSDIARSAVDFNTLLIQARQKDLRNNKKDNYEIIEGGSQEANYNAAVDRMFGESGGSATFAPETVALLNKVGFEQSSAKKFDDLDDFLGLASAIGVKDLEKLSSLEVPSPVTTDAAGRAQAGAAASAPGLMATGDTRAAAVSGLVSGTQELQEQMGVAGQQLRNWRQAGAGALNTELEAFNGLPNKLTSPDIRAGADTGYFERAYALLADSSNDPSVVDAIKSGLNAKELNRFLDYADSKTTYAARYANGELGGDPTVQYRTAEDFRSLLGLKGSGTDGTA